MITRRTTSISCTVTLFCASVTARANGRFPTSTFLAVAPGPDGDRLALQTTFGTASSRDGGRRWQWTCEAALGFSGDYDPVSAFTDDGALIVTLPDGLVRTSAEGCEVARPEGAPRDAVIDVAADATGRIVLAATASFALSNEVARSDDGGRTWHAAATFARLSIETIDVAPDSPSRVYLSGYLPGSTPVVYASDDGGGSFVETTRDLHGGYSVFLSGVVAGSPDTVFARTDLFDGGTLLLRSDDAARTFHDVTRTRTRMRGFAIGTSASDLWVAGDAPDDGVRHSTDGGASWTALPLALHARCVRTSGPRVYVCADETLDGYSLAESDDGVAFHTVFAHDRLGPPLECPVGSAVRDTCAPMWPATAARFDGGTSVVSHDASLPDDARPVERDATIAPPSPDLDATVTIADANGAVSDAHRAPAGSDCHCSVAGALRAREIPSRSTAVAWGAIAGVASTCRRRSRATLTA